MNKFIYEHAGERIEMTVVDNATLDEMLESFTRFLLAQGYQLTEPFATLELRTDWKA